MIQWSKYIVFFFHLNWYYQTIWCHMSWTMVHVGRLKLGVVTRSWHMHKRITYIQIFKKNSDLKCMCTKHLESDFRVGHQGERFVIVLAVIFSNHSFSKYYVDRKNRAYTTTTTIPEIRDPLETKMSYKTQQTQFYWLSSWARMVNVTLFTRPSRSSSVPNKNEHIIKIIPKDHKI